MRKYSPQSQNIMVFINLASLVWGWERVQRHSRSVSCMIIRCVSLIYFWCIQLTIIWDLIWQINLNLEFHFCLFFKPLKKNASDFFLCVFPCRNIGYYAQNPDWENCQKQFSIMSLWGHLLGSSWYCFWQSRMWGSLFKIVWMKRNVLQ